MSHYNNQEFDFINRTKTIIKQYENLKIPKNEKYEVTLLINCLVGLLIVPQQNWFDKLPTSIISQKEWGIDEMHISFIKKGETKNVKDVARHLRNSVAHYRFTAFENQSKDISSIRFEDEDNTGITFNAVIPISCIRQFTTKLTDTFTKEMIKTKST